MNLLINTFFAGFFYLLAGLFGLTRHFLLEPRMPDLPKTPRWLLRVSFGFSVVMVYAGLRYLTAWGSGIATTVPPAATGFGVLLAFSIFTYKGSLLYDTWTRKASFSLDELLDRMRNL